MVGGSPLGTIKKSDTVRYRPKGLKKPATYAGFLLPGCPNQSGPGLLAEDFAGAANLQAELRRPDGSIVSVPLFGTAPLSNSATQGVSLGLLFSTLSRRVVPAGTEVWVDGL